MGLDRVSLEMLTPHIRGARVLCLGYPDHPEGKDTRQWLEDHGALLVDVVDVIAHKGFERIVDLNVPQTWHTHYDLIINPGTLEHCFNIGIAWENAWHALAVGGHALHVFPASLFNHGFWNVNPVAVYDWCEANGGEILSTRMAINGSGYEVKVEKIKTSGSGRGQIPSETVLYALCRKNEERMPRWPTQGCYRR